MRGADIDLAAAAAGRSGATGATGATTQGRRLEEEDEYDPLEVRRPFSVSIWTIGFPFFLYSYGNHRIFGTFYALVVVLSYGKLGHFRVKWPDFPIYSIIP